MDFCANCSHGCKTKRAPTAVQVLVALQALQAVALAMLAMLVAPPPGVMQALPLLVPTVLALLTVLATGALVLLMAVLTTAPRTGRK